MVQQHKVKRQFHSISVKRTFYDRKVNTSGFSRQLSLSKVIPKEWKYVRITKVEETDHMITLKIEKLYGDGAHPLPYQTGQRGQPHT